MRRSRLALAAVAGMVVWVLLSPGQSRPSGYELEAGGTPEENLWEFLVVMGVSDREPAHWDGRASVANGELHSIEGYRFDPPDRVLPDGGWRLQTKVERVRSGYGVPVQQMLLPKGVLLRGSGGPGTRVTIATPHGECSVMPMQLDFGDAEPCADGRAEVRRVPATTDLSGTELRQHDLPSLGAGPDGTLWATWLSFHNQREELNLRRYQGGRWTRLIPVARASEDLWRPQAVTDATGTPWLVWSQQIDGNWDIFAMPWETDQWGALVQLSRGALPDIEPHVARAGDGTVYVVWQAMEGRAAQIHLACLRGGKWSDPVAVTSGPENHWEPAVAAGNDGRAWIVWDVYRASYDVFARSYSPEDGLSPEMEIAATPHLEAYASVAVDARNRPWIAWETGGVNWGKDLGPLSPRSTGSPLGDRRRIQVVALDQGTWKSAPEFAPRDALDAGASSRCRPLLYSDPSGTVWMTFKRRYSRMARNPSTFWESFLTRLDGSGWAHPILLPGSGARNSTRMGIASSGGRLWLFWPSETRRYDFASRPRLNRVLAGSLALPVRDAESPLTVYSPARDTASVASANEARDVEVIRRHRVRVGGDTMRIVRGDLHRHTELSQDQGGFDDGSLPEFYRYMIDAANMDFGASTDHQAGGTDYWAYMTWKFADMYHVPERFIPLYGYERNLGFPHGHRNIIHTRRNYPIVPFFQRPDPKFLLPDSPDGELLTFNSNSFGGGIPNDTKLLYEELRKSGGIAIPHTSGSSGMGTDWRDNDRELEPLVEIYQGDRHNYEHKNAPRGVRDSEERKAIGGFQEAGLVWNAWKKGYKLGVIASSDHFSTHISYAMVYTPGHERQAIFDAMRKRHAYGATDNIVLEFWIGDRFMGDVFASSRREKLRIKVHGTAAVATVHIIRDAKYIHRSEPRTIDVDLEYVDQEAGPGEHWYYVRVEQENGELAWSSPIWLTNQTDSQ